MQREEIHKQTFSYLLVLIPYSGSGLCLECIQFIKYSYTALFFFFDKKKEFHQKAYDVHYIPWDYSFKDLNYQWHLTLVAYSEYALLFFYHAHTWLCKHCCFSYNYISFSSVIFLFLPNWEEFSYAKVSVVMSNSFTSTKICHACWATSHHCCLYH